VSLPEFVTPVLSITGPSALVFVIMRCFPHTARAVVVLLAGIVAIVTRDPERRAACHKVLDTLTRRDGKPDDLPDLGNGSGGIARRAGHGYPLPRRSTSRGERSGVSACRACQDVEPQHVCLGTGSDSLVWQLLLVKRPVRKHHVGERLRPTPAKSANSTQRPEQCGGCYGTASTPVLIGPAIPACAPASGPRTCSTVLLHTSTFPSRTTTPRPRNSSGGRSAHRGSSRRGPACPAAVAVSVPIHAVRLQPQPDPDRS
jgi:hypothetical protein